MLANIRDAFGVEVVGATAGGSGTLFIYLPLNFLKSEGKPQASSLLFLLSGGLSGGQFPVRVSQSDDVRVF